MLIGTENGGLNIYNREKEWFEHPFRNHHLFRGKDISVNAITTDPEGNLYIGTDRNLMKLDTDGNLEKVEPLPRDRNTNFVDCFVRSLVFDDNERLWIGTTQGLFLYEPVAGFIEEIPVLSENEKSREIFIIFRDNDGSVWIGTLNEIVIYNYQNDKVIRHNERTKYFHEDSQKRYWIATLDKGLAEYSKTGGPIRYFTEKDGLVNNQTLCILEDDNKHLWISTSNGLSDFDIAEEHFTSFTTMDGIVNNQFNYGAALRIKNGELLFGGISGFNIFDPAEIVTEDYEAPLVFTELRIFNKPVPVSDEKNAILNKSISETDHLVLDYFQNVITLEFTALDYINSSTNLYSYFLEGFDKGWNEPGYSRTATYTNLFPGDYVLHIKRILPGNNQDNKELTLKLTITPPYWMTWWFRSLIFFLILTLIYFLFRFLRNREKIKNELIFEKTKARTLHELDMLKLKLFTNISHEIRTPLTLILGPLEKLVNNMIPKEEVKTHLELVHRNTKKLDQLINQLLDFRKLESGSLNLEKRQDDLVPHVSGIVRSFGQYAEEKQITLKFNSLRKCLISFYDPGKIETILSNLISNAIKYTDEGSLILSEEVCISILFRRTAAADGASSLT